MEEAQSCVQASCQSSYCLLLLDDPYNFNDGMEDYYIILGISRGADAQTIKKAYHSLALRDHPDRNRLDAGAKARFQKASKMSPGRIFTDSLMRLTTGLRFKRHMRSCVIPNRDIVMISYILQAGQPRRLQSQIQQGQTMAAIISKIHPYSRYKQDSRLPNAMSNVSVIVCQN